MRRHVPAALLLIAIAYVGIVASASPLGKTEVFVTAGGDKYHRAGCRYLTKSKSKMSISLGDAVKKYAPCSVCKPSLAENAPPDSGDKKPEEKDADIKIDTSYLDKTWGIKLKAVRVEPQGKSITFLMEFSTDVEKPKEMREAFAPPPSTKLSFVHYDHENVIITRTTLSMTQGELTGNKDDAFRVVLRAEIPTAQKQFLMTRKIVVRPIETK